MDYHVFILFQFSYLYNFGFHIMTYLIVETEFQFNALAIKAVMQS